MSKADELFVSMCQDILDNGTTTEGERVRPHWEDGTPAYTIKRFGVTNRYDLREEFPAITLRRTALKSAMDEVLWIYQRKSNDIHDLHSHIWDQWADETGSIGKAYGYQIAQVSHYPEGDFDQMDRVLYDLRLAANNWNVCQYAILLMMVAQSVGMVAGELLHVIADAHIYDRHVDVVRELISRPQHPAPKVSLNPDVTDFYAFTTDDLIVEGYEHGPQVRDIPIAV